MVRVLVGLALSLTVLTGCVGGTRTESGPVERPSPSGIDEELREELVTMETQDQDERTGGEAELSDTERTARLEEIIAEHGALELLREAVADGQASPGDLASLEHPSGLDERRAEVGLPPYHRYLHTMARPCRDS